MDAFTRRVELDNGDEVADLTQSQPLQPPYGGDGDPVASAAATAGEETGASTTTLDDDQVVPGQEHHLGPLMRRRHPLYEGTSKPRCRENNGNKHCSAAAFSLVKIRTTIRTAGPNYNPNPIANPNPNNCPL